MTGKALTRDQEIAAQILVYFGGRQNLISLVGAHQFVAIENGLQFRYKLCRKHNTLRIKLNGRDLFDVEFWKITPKTCKIVAEFSNYYFDMLQDLFVEETGLNLVLFDAKTLADAPVWFKNRGVTK